MAMSLSKPRIIAQDTQSRGEMIEDLFQQHWTRLCQVLYRLLGDWDEAQDLALEAFYQLYRKPPPNNQNLGGWLYRVACNMGLNTLRSQKRRQHYEDQALQTPDYNEHEDDPAILVERIQERQRVRAVLESIKPRSAQLLVLRYSGLSYAEIAIALKIAPSSVGALLARAEKEFDRQYRRQESFQPPDVKKEL